MKYFAIAVLLVLIASRATAAEPVCAKLASEQARKLLVFHVGKGFEDQMSFEQPIPKAPIKNPTNSKQVFNVLEVEGFVSPRGIYRMRFIFYLLPRDCLLMGQELLEMANP